MDNRTFSLPFNPPYQKNKRLYIPPALKNLIWKKANNKCENCGLDFTQKSNLKFEREQKIIEFSTNCWKCKEPDNRIFLIEKYGKKLEIYIWITKLPYNLLSKIQNRYSYKKMFSGTLKRYYYGNYCKFCGNLQGDWLLMDELFDILANDEKPQIKSIWYIDIFYPVIHHKDKNPQNNSLDNLVLLCSYCHYEQIHKFREDFNALMISSIYY
ncbi:MAG: HNH endonuclease signature motif containing protein [Candidatus Altiarchaeota archaeon]